MSIGISIPKQLHLELTHTPSVNKRCERKSFYFTGSLTEMEPYFFLKKNILLAFWNPWTLKNSITKIIFKFPEQWNYFKMCWKFCRFLPLTFLGVMNDRTLENWTVYWRSDFKITLRNPLFWLADMKIFISVLRVLLIFFSKEADSSWYVVTLYFRLLLTYSKSEFVAFYQVSWQIEFYEVRQCFLLT